MRGVKYTLTIENLSEFQDHVFIAYPTSNSGFGYVLEEGKPITNLMMSEGWKGPGTSLYAMTRKAFDEHDPNPSAYPHGDNDVVVKVVPAPPGPPRALKAEADISPPGLVPDDSPVAGIERVFRITKLDSGGFELTLLRTITTHTDGSKKTQELVKSAAAKSEKQPTPSGDVAAKASDPTTKAKPAPPENPPSQRGCAGCGVSRRDREVPAFVALLLVVAAVVRRSFS